MFSRKLMTAALAVVAAGAFAGSAQASVIDYDDVRLTSVGYDFGGDGFALGEPVGSGEIHFHHENGGQIRPHLLGAIHLNDADGTCGRMRMEYYNAAGSLLTTRYGGEVCVTDDQHHWWSVDLDPYSSVGIHSVRVSVQKETFSGWSTTTSLTYTADTHDDDFEITEDGVDFGGPTWSLGQPTTPGGIEWLLSTNGYVTPILRGAIHLNNSAGVCARMNMRYLTESGSLLASRAGGTVCSPDNGHHYWSVSLMPYVSNQIGQVQVQLQTLGSNGVYVTAGSQTVSINE
jgi:hypothetical protein